MSEIKDEVEIWKSITIDDDKYNTYQVSSLGRIKNKFDKILSPKITNGYHMASLRIPSRSSPKHFSIHRIVALEFIPNNNNDSEVNHIDGNRTNNKVSNLEWIDGKGNAQHARDTLNKTTDTKKVIRIDPKTNEEVIYDSINLAAEKNNIHPSGISMVLSNKQKTAARYKWKYFDQSNNITKLTKQDLDDNYKKINGYDTYYISNDGKIYNTKGNKFLKPSFSNKNYRVNLCKDGVINTKNIHNLVAQNFISNPDNKQFVMFLDGDRANYNYSNLAWCTRSEATINGKNIINDDSDEDLIENMENLNIASSSKE